MLEKIAETGLTNHRNTISKVIESMVINVGKGLDHNRSLESIVINISNSIIVGLSIITVRMLTSIVLHSINKIQINHVRQKYGKELKEVDKLI